MSNTHSSDPVDASEADSTCNPHLTKLCPLLLHFIQQKLKTQELQMAEMYEDTSDQIEAIEADLAAFKKEAKRDVEAARNDLLGALKSGFEAVDDKVDAAVKDQDERLEQYQKVCGGGWGRGGDWGLGGKGGELGRRGWRERGSQGAGLWG